MKCSNCHKTIPKRVLRKGRANYICAKCGKDVSLLLFLTEEAGIPIEAELMEQKEQELAPYPR